MVYACYPYLYVRDHEDLTVDDESEECSLGLDADNPQLWLRRCGSAAYSF